MSEVKSIFYPKAKGDETSNVGFEINGKIRGNGFTDEGRTYVALQRCPECGRENYAANVLSGQCTWCPFNVTQAQ